MAIGALLNAVYDADRALDGGRVLFLLDEVARLGYMNIMEVARDAGRTYGITLMLAASLEAYRPGGLVVVRAALRDPNRLSTIPADGVGGFVYIGGPIPLNDIETREGALHRAGWGGSPGLAKGQGSRALPVGRGRVAHLGSSYSGPTCFLQAWLENRSLDQRTALVSLSSSDVHDATATLVLGAKLQPGVYRMRARTVCTGQQGVISTVELLKTPSELNLRPVTGADLLRREG